MIELLVGLIWVSGLRSTEAEVSTVFHSSRGNFSIHSYLHLCVWPWFISCRFASWFLLLKILLWIALDPYLLGFFFFPVCLWLKKNPGNKLLDQRAGDSGILLDNVRSPSLGWHHLFPFLMFVSHSDKSEAFGLIAWVLLKRKFCWQIKICILIIGCIVQGAQKVKSYRVKTNSAGCFSVVGITAFWNYVLKNNSCWGGTLF